MHGCSWDRKLAGAAATAALNAGSEGQPACLLDKGDAGPRRPHGRVQAARPGAGVAAGVPAPLAGLPAPEPPAAARRGAGLQPGAPSLGGARGQRSLSLWAALSSLLVRSGGRNSRPPALAERPPARCCSIPQACASCAVVVLLSAAADLRPLPATVASLRAAGWTAGEVYALNAEPNPERHRQYYRCGGAPRRLIWPQPQPGSAAPVTRSCPRVPGRWRGSQRGGCQPRTALRGEA